MLKVKLIIPDTAKTEESESQTGNCKKLETDNIVQEIAHF